MSAYGSTCPVHGDWPRCGCRPPNPPRKKLTPAQERILADVKRDRECVYNGRARKPIKALEEAGLVTVDWDMRPQVKGNGMELVELITVRPRMLEVERAEVRAAAQRLERRRAGR